MSEVDTDLAETEKRREMFDTQIQNRGIKELKRCAKESVADLMD